MANYATLKAAVQSVVKSNGNKEITGTNMQSTLLDMITSLAGGYLFKGIGTTSTSPGTPDQNVFYIVGEGTYTNFGDSYTVNPGSIGVFRYNGSWSRSQLKLLNGLDDVPTTDSDNVAKSGGIALFNEIPFSFQNDYYLRTNGNVSSTTAVNNFSVSDYIHIEKVMYITGLNGASGQSYTVIAFYDFNKTFISNITGTGSTREILLDGTNIPANAAYIRAGMKYGGGNVYISNITGTDIATSASLDTFPAWKASTSYAVDDIVRYGSAWTLYRCKSAHTSGSSFDTTKWEVTDMEYIDKMIRERKMFSDIYCQIGCYLRKSDGKLVFPNPDLLANRLATDYIDISIIGKNSIRFYGNGSTSDLCFYDENKAFLGSYTSPSSNVRTLSYDSWSAACPAGTKYLRCSLTSPYPVMYGFIGYITPSDDMIPHGNGYINTASNIIDSMVKQVEITSVNFADYDHVSLQRLRGWSSRNDNSAPMVLILGWKDGVYSYIVRAYSRDCMIDEDSKTLLYYNGKDRVLIDYSKFYDTGDYWKDLAEHSHTELSAKCFTNVDYRQNIGSTEYVAYTGSDSSDIYDAAARSFTYMSYRYPSMMMPDITFQRVPLKSNVMVEGSEEFFCMYSWDGDTKLSTTYIYIRDCTINGDVVRFESEDLTFEFDYAVFGSTYSIATITKTYITVQPKSLILQYKPDRPDLEGRKYANVSSSTFSSFTWHELCIQALGMDYANYGMGGSCHRPYSLDAQYNPDYQDPDEPVADRNVMNMVAKMCIDAANNGYYPDVIASCCVLNDCYTSAIPIGTSPSTKIGSLEEAISITMPTFDLSTETSIVTDFTDFFDSSDEGIVAIKSKSMNMMFLAFQLLSQRFPKSQMFICSSQIILNSSFNQEAIDYFNAEQKKLAKYFSIPYVDLNGECGINRITAPTFLKADLLHPNDAGSLVYTNYYTMQMVNRIAFKK